VNREERIASKMVADLRDVKVVESQGKVSLFEETLSDGSKAYSVSLYKSDTEIF